MIVHFERLSDRAQSNKSKLCELANHNFSYVLFYVLLLHYQKKNKLFHNNFLKLFH